MVLRLLDSPRQLVSRPVVKKDRGGILIISLLSLCLLTTFAVILSYGVRQKIILVQRLEERRSLHFIAEAGIKKAIAGLKKEKGVERTYASLADNWSNNIGAFKGIGVGQGMFNICYNHIEGRSGLSETRYGLVDEERKININKANKTILENLFQVVLGLDEVDAQEIAASLVDWRDKDSELSIPLGSAEDSDYLGLQYPYESRDREFEVLEEALLVKGMRADIFGKIRGYITVYGDGKVNVNTASKEILLALGLKEDLVDKIILFRQGEDEISGTVDDNVFKVHSEIVPGLSQFAHLSDSEIAELSRIVENNLVINSNNFMIRCIARLHNRKNIHEVICVVDRSGRILYWNEI